MLRRRGEEDDDRDRAQHDHESGSQAQAGPARRHRRQMRPQTADERGDEERNRGGEEGEGGQPRHHEAPEAAGLDRRDACRALEDDVAEKPTEQQAGRRNRAPRHCERPCERQPLDDPSAPRELAQVGHVLLPRLRIEMHRPLEPRRRKDGVAWSRGERDGALCEERDLTGPLVLPDRERDERRRECDREEDDMPPTPREDEGEGRAGEEDDVGRLDRERDTGERPGEDRLAVRARPPARARSRPRRRGPPRPTGNPPAA